jgi:predicted dehydrogenase
MYRVGVIGLGSIAAMYSTPEETAPYSHVGGIRHSERVTLAAVADLQETVRERFRERWGGAFSDTLPYYESSTAMLAAEPFDIVAVCVRGPDHFAVTMEVIEAGPRAIFLEKPPSCSLEEMDAMVAAARAKRIPITVSYSRHWCPHVLRLQELVQGELIGQVEKVVAYTGHAFLSFASHVTDLICQFAGYCPKAIFARGRVTGDAPAGYEPEPALDAAIIEFGNGVLGVHVGPQGERGGFYADVLGTEGTVQAGIYTPPVARTKKGEPIDLAAFGMPENASVFRVAYDQIADYLDGGPLPHCTDADFIAVNEIGFGGIESALTGRRIELPNLNRSRKVFANG